MRRTRIPSARPLLPLLLSDQESLSGEIINAEVSIRHNTFENGHFGLKYAYFDVRVDFEELERLSAIDYTYHGPALSFEFVF